MVLLQNKTLLHTQLWISNAIDSEDRVTLQHVTMGDLSFVVKKKNQVNMWEIKLCYNH